MPRIDESRSVVNDESDAGEGTFPRELDEILVRSEIIVRNTENRCSWMEREALIIPKDDFVIFRKDFIDRIYKGSGMSLYYKELVSEEDIITCRSESLGVKIAQCDGFIKNCFFYVQIREKHGVVN